MFLIGRENTDAISKGQRTKIIIDIGFLCAREVLPHLLFFIEFFSVRGWSIHDCILYIIKEDNML
jgi:hypothetical protein